MSDPNLYTQITTASARQLVGLHISSKVLPDWVWATFEPASAITNPNRCDPNLYSTCFDPWGTTSSTPYGKGQTVPQKPELQQLMTASEINPVFKNYYLTGAQTQFVDGGKPIPLGSSFIEFNAGVPPGQACRASPATNTRTSTAKNPRAARKTTSAERPQAGRTSAMPAAPARAAATARRSRPIPPRRIFPGCSG